MVVIGGSPEAVITGRSGRVNRCAITVIIARRMGVRKRPFSPSFACPGGRKAVLADGLPHRGTVESAQPC